MGSCGGINWNWRSWCDRVVDLRCDEVPGDFEMGRSRVVPAPGFQSSCTKSKQVTLKVRLSGAHCMTVAGTCATGLIQGHPKLATGTWSTVVFGDRVRLITASFVTQQIPRRGTAIRPAHPTPLAISFPYDLSSSLLSALTLPLCLTFINN